MSNYCVNNVYEEYKRYRKLLKKAKQALKEGRAGVTVSVTRDITPVYSWFHPEDPAGDEIGPTKYSMTIEWTDYEC